MCAGPQETAGQIAPELNEFEKQGIQFRVITEDMVPACLDFLWDQFAPQVGSHFGDCSISSCPIDLRGKVSIL
jgi:hypothetical protein